jgi:hypothetical protein
MQRLYPAIYDSTFAQFEPTDHFRGTSLDPAWTWQGSPFSGTPPTANLSIFPSHLVIGGTTAGQHYLLTRSFSGSTPVLVGRFIPGTRHWIGLRIDEGGNNNPAAIHVRSLNGRTMIAISTASGGVPVVNNVHVAEVPAGPVTLAMYHTGSNVYFYYSTEPHFVAGNFHGLQFLRSASHALTRSRWGISFYNEQSVGDNADFHGAVDWVSQLSSSVTTSAASYPGYYPIAARYTTNTAQSCANNTFVRVNFEDVTFDPHSLVTTGANWAFTAPVDGVYLVAAGVLFETTTAWKNDESGTLSLWKNGVVQSHFARTSAYSTAALGTHMPVIGSDTVQLANGDTIYVTALQNTGGSLNLYNDGNHNFVNVAKFPW